MKYRVSILRRAQKPGEVDASKHRNFSRHGVGVCIGPLTSAVRFGTAEVLLDKMECGFETPQPPGMQFMIVD